MAQSSVWTGLQIAHNRLPQVGSRKSLSVTPMAAIEWMNRVPLEYDSDVMDYPAKLEPE